MEFEPLLNPTRWGILESIVKGPATISEIAERLQTSVPNVSQQARYLEAMGLLTKRSRPAKGRGKPRTEYQLKREIAFLACVHKGLAAKRVLTPDEFHMMIMNILFWPRRDDHYFLEKFLWQIEQPITECQAIAITKSEGDEIHLLVVTNDEHLEEFRKRYSRLEIAYRDGTRKIVCWTHTEAELQNGLERGEAYYQNHLRSTHIIMDRVGVFTRVSA